MSPAMRIFTSVLLAALTTAPSHARAQQASTAPQASAAATAPLAQALPIDPEVTVGRFDNGLRYYIRKNGRPEKRAELRLAVNVGSILEDDDQLGLAHFVEHMAFNGTTHFPKQEMIAFLESIGMKFGPSINAFTGFDETVYMLQVPTDKPDAMKKSFQILEDWAHNVTFDPVEIDKERGVIVEEWRLRRGAGARMQDQQFPVLLKGSRYATRLPVGTMEVVQNFKHERLKKFYTDWYRPELMAVVAVGDFDVTEIEGLIKQHFGSIPKSPATKLRPAYGVPDHPGTLYAVATDKEAAATSVTVYSKMAPRDRGTVGAYRREIVESLFSSMLSTRYGELAQKPDPPFLGAGTGRGAFVRGKDATTLGAGVKEDGIERGLEALYTEAERVARHGFTASELDRTKRNLLRGIERAVAEQKTQFSTGYAMEYVNHYLQQEPVPGILYENALYQRFLPEITLAEINALAKTWAPENNRVVVVSAPQKDGLMLPTEARLASVMASVVKKDIAPYVDTATDEPLLAAAPAPGTIATVVSRDAVGVTEWQLSNGVKVVLKPTTFKADEILFRATSPGGVSLAPDDNFISASTASQVVGMGGLGKFSNIELTKKLSGKVASARPVIGDLDEGLVGSGTRKDLETMFQLIYMRFTEPRADAQLFDVMKTQTKTVLANQMNEPEVVFADTLSRTLSQDHPRARRLTPEMVDQMDLQKAVAFYKDRFADASDFTFVFVGSFDLETMKPLVERYLGALPSTRRKESWRDVGMTRPTGVVEKRVNKGIEPKSQAALVFTGPFKYDQTQRVAIRVMADVLQNRLREKLREDLGGTYSVSVGAGYSKIPREEYSISIDFGSNPTRTEELVKEVLSEIEALKANGPTEKQVSDVREGMLRDYETSVKQNGYLLNQIVARYQIGDEVDTLFAVPDYYRKITVADVQAAARTYLNTGNYVKVTLFPETQK